MSTGEGLRGDYSVYARNFGDLGSDNYADNDIQNLLFTANHFYGNWQLMTTVMTAQGNDDLKDNTSTTGSYALRSDNTAKNGYYAMLALHDKQQFYGLAPGVSESALQYGVGLGAEARQPGSDGDLTENAASLRFASYGILPLGKNWQLAPSVIAQHSEDRYRDGDRYDWATFNLRVSGGSPLTSPCCMRPRGSIWISIRTGAAIAIMTTFISIRRCAVISTS